MVLHLNKVTAQTVKKHPTRLCKRQPHTNYSLSYEKDCPQKYYRQPPKLLTAVNDYVF